MKAQWYRIGGVRIRVDWEEILHLPLAEVFVYFGIQPAEEAGDAHARLQLRIAPTGLRVPLDADERPPLSPHIQASQAGSSIFLHGEKSVFRLDLTASQGQGWIHPDLLSPSSTHRWIVMEFILWSLLLLLRSHRLYPLHAAAVQRDDAGFLLVADSNSGKSTLSYSLVRSGWDYLSDDAILLKADDQTVTAFGFRKVFALDEKSQSLFPEMDSSVSWRLGDEPKWAIPVETIFPRQAAEHCAPSVLIFPCIVDAPESRLIPISQREAFYLIVRQSALLSLAPASDHLDVLKHLLKQTRHYRLQAGRDFLTHPERVTALLAPLLREPNLEWSYQ